MDRRLAYFNFWVFISPEIQKVLIDQDNKRIDIILTEENLSKAIGRRGQNVRLASKLTNYEIDILTDKEDSEEDKMNSRKNRGLD